MRKLKVRFRIKFFVVRRREKTTIKINNLKLLKEMGNLKSDTALLSMCILLCSPLAQHSTLLMCWIVVDAAIEWVWADSAFAIFEHM
jgi:hypothetical protein